MLNLYSHNTAFDPQSSAPLSVRLIDLSQSDIQVLKDLQIDGIWLCLNSS